MEIINLKRLLNQTEAFFVEWTMGKQLSDIQPRSCRKN